MAKKFPLDLSKFSYIAHDDDSVSMRHYEGHEIKIARKKLSKETKDALDSLVSKGLARKAKNIEKDKANKTQDEIQPRQKFAEGGVARGFTTELDRIDQDPETQQLLNNDINALSLADTVTPNFNPSGTPVSLDPTPDWKKVLDADPNGAKALGKFQSNINEGIAPSPPPAIEAVAPTPVTMSEQPMPQMPSAAPTMPVGMPSMAGAPTMMQGYNNAVAGLAGAAKAAGALGQDQAAILQQNIEEDRIAAETYQNAYNELEAERQMHMQDIAEGHVDPDKYWTGDKNGNGSHSRIAAGIGMILAGFNPTTQPNAAINFLKHQMDLNIEAQKANLNSKHNLLSANMQQFGNLRAATDMTRIMQNDIVTNQLQAAMAKAATPAAKAEMQKAIGMLQMETAKKVQDLAARQAMAQLEQPGADPRMIEKMISIMPPEQQKEYNHRYVPGVGLARSPEDKKIVIESLDRRNNIQANVQKAIGMIKKRGTWEMIGPHNEILDGLASDIATDQAKLQDPTSIARPSEVEEVKKNLIEAGLTKRNDTAQKILQAFSNKTDERAGRIFQSRGLRLPQAPQSTQNEIVTHKNGKQYRKVPGGYVPVK